MNIVSKGLLLWQPYFLAVKSGFTKIRVFYTDYLLNLVFLYRSFNFLCCFFAAFLFTRTGKTNIIVG